MFLDDATFRMVVSSTPLVSIDLIVRNLEGDLLLGLRRNRPARGSWFVPGGRVLKGETLDEAFSRLVQEELGQHLDRAGSKLLGVFEHFYDDSIFGENTNTHYVVIAHHLSLAIPLDEIPKAQHVGFRWWKLEEAMMNSDVHLHTKQYFEHLAERNWGYE